MASSEQFFFKWAETNMQKKCEIIQIVDLPKEQAQTFYNLIIKTFRFLVMKKKNNYFRGINAFNPKMLEKETTYFVQKN